MEPLRGTSSPSTVRVIAAVLFAGGVLLYFDRVPGPLRWPVRVLWVFSTAWLVMAFIRVVCATRFTGRKIVFIGVLGVFYYLVLTLICHVFIKLMSQRDDRLTTRGAKNLSAECKAGIKAALSDDQFTKYSSKIGWVPQPGWGGSGYDVTMQGLRGKKDYPVQPVDPGRRILCMGDSFTFGISVKTDEAYPSQAEQLRPGTEWLNFGIPGGCLVQSYLRYMHDARAYGGKRVVIGFMSNDAQRTVNAFRPFLNPDSGCPLPKPFAKLVGGRFSIEPNPIGELPGLRRLLDDERGELGRLLECDYLSWCGFGGQSAPITRTLAYIWESMRLDRNLDNLLDERVKLGTTIGNAFPKDPYGRAFWEQNSPGFKAVCLMFEKYHEQVLADERQPLFVIIPGPIDVEDCRRKRPCQYAPLIEYLTARKLPFIDFLDSLAEKHQKDLSEEALFVRNHYTAPVNKELAEEIIRALKLP